MKSIVIADRIFAGLLLIFALLHSVGSLKAYAFLTPELVWAISASVLAMLVAVLNFVRAGRPRDVTLAWICFAGCLAWAILALSFGISIGNVFDPRPLLHSLAALALAAFSFRTAVGAAAYS